MTYKSAQYERKVKTSDTKHLLLTKQKQKKKNLFKTCQVRKALAFIKTFKSFSRKDLNKFKGFKVSCGITRAKL